MLKISATELKKHFGKYMVIAQNEEVVVTRYGKHIFTLTPKNLKQTRWESFFGILPIEAATDQDIDRE